MGDRRKGIWELSAHAEPLIFNVRIPVVCKLDPFIADSFPS